MEKEYVKALNDLREELRIPQQLYRVIVVYSLIACDPEGLGQNNDKVVELASEAMRNVDPSLTPTVRHKKIDVRGYGRKLVENAFNLMQEKQIK